MNKPLHRLYQVALFQSVALGEYYGVMTVGEFKQKGDTGIGIFEAVNGELILLDGVVYQAIHDGSVFVPDDDYLIPYGNAAFFTADYVLENVTASSLSELENRLNEFVEKEGRNQFYMAKISGNFSHVAVRSELRQEEPFRMLNIALRSDQRKYEYDNMSGTMVGLFCPDYMQSMNAPGWHFHFVSDDRSKGGHLTESVPDNCRAEICKISRFVVDIPDNDTFNGRDLGKDLMSAIREAEKGDF